MMRRIHIFVMLLLLVSCDKGKQNDNNEAQVPYWGDSVDMWVSSTTEGSTSFNLRGFRTDSVCLFFQYVTASATKSELDTSCAIFDSSSKPNTIKSFGIVGMNLLENRSLRLDFYAIAWIDGEPYRSKDQWTYGGYTYHINGDTLYQFDSTRPLVFPDSMECNQALALFFQPPQTTYWNEDVQCLGIADLNCLDKDPRLYKRENNCVIKFNGDLNDAATHLERAAPGNFITLYPWCVGLKDCGGEEPAQ